MSRKARARAGGPSIALCAALAFAPMTRAAPPVVGGCPVFPADNVWNVRVDALPVHPQSNAWVATVGATRPLHPDFGTVWNGAPNGIPWIVAPAGSPAVAVRFEYDDESDAGPWPIPPDAPVEGGSQSQGDRHVIIVDPATCRLHELFAAYPNADGSWRAGSGAIFDLRSHALRPAGWTSADAAGLPILPGLVRYDEAFAGEIAHALRFTAPQTRGEYVWPARHEASSLSGSDYPPMGARFRLKADVDVSAFPASVRPILVALERYGMMLADNGSSWFLSGAPDPRWSDDDLHALSRLTGASFEAVDVSSLVVDPDSGATRAPLPPDGDAAIEFHRASTGDYFMTSNPAEIALLDAGALPGWRRTGESIRVAAPGTRAFPAATPVCRFWGLPQAGLDTHFYSASPDECQAVLDRFGAAWLLESREVFAVALPDAVTGACPPGSEPVHRLFNGRRAVNHRYVTSSAQKQAMLSEGWVAEGYGSAQVAMCTPPASTKASSVP